LIGSLSHEKERWIKQIEILNRNKLTIISDSILASAFITYLGAFDVTYREKAVNIIWKSLILSAGLITAEEFNLSNSIGV
jgi:dynein heavy chain, axonemal